MPLPAVFTLDGVPRRYAWGSPTAIPALRGTEPDGQPVAELWFGAHATGASAALGTTLDRLIGTDPPAVLGVDAVHRLGAQLPFLVKLLAAEHALSIQVHPSREQAEAGFAAEDAAGLAREDARRNYRDRNHKPELLCALSEFEAFCGFRPVTETLELLDALGVGELAPLRALLAADAAAEPGREPLRAAFAYLLALDDPAPMVTALVAGATALAATDSPWAATARALTLAAADFPGDVGVALALLLNHVRLQPGEAVYLGAGVVHSYLRGLAVEVMANSDNVLRCGLTAKYADPGELLRVTDFSECPDPRCTAEVTEAGVRYRVPVADFALRTVELDTHREPGRAVELDTHREPEQTASESVLGDAGRPYLVLCLTGTVRVEAAGTAVTLTPAGAAFVPAGDRPITLTGTGRVAVVTTGDGDSAHFAPGIRPTTASTAPSTGAMSPPCTRNSGSTGPGPQWP